jgi:serine protease AprX
MSTQFQTRLNRFVSISVALSLTMALMLVPGSAPAAAATRQSVIVQGQPLEAVVGAVERAGGTVTSRLDVINGVGALLTPAAAAGLRADPAITAIAPNAEVTLLGGGDDDDEGGKGPRSPATDYADLVGADLLWQQGVTGQGVTVAVVDTGIARHRGLTKDINGRKGRILAWVDFVDGKRKPHDFNGHGTHIAGIIANSQKGEDREWNGVAPGVNLVAVRVLDEAGVGTYEKVIQGIQWVIAHRDEYNIRVMNLSLVSPVQSPYWADPLNQAVMQAWANGIVVVVAAGNGGPNAMTIGVPGNNPYVITVGAFTDNYTPTDWSDDYIAPFSAAGPTLDGFVKPDVVAPGAHMVSTMLPSSSLARSHQASQVGNQYFSMAGTSQSAAVVSGIAALLISKNPGLTPDQVKFRMMVTSFLWVNLETSEALYSMWQQGAGRVNAPDAVLADISGTANAGLDVQADLAGTQHFEGYSYYDETAGMFALRGGYGSWAGGYGSWAGGYGSWAGGYGSWAGGYGSWAGGYGSWAGGYGSWAGGYGSWAGGYGSWAGGYGSWAGGYGSWAGGYGSWAGGYGSWAGGYGSWAGSYGSADFASQFANWSGEAGYGSWAGSLQWVGSWFDY